jgi:thymidylate synthase (FAD)
MINKALFKKNINVELKYHTPLSICANSQRTCWDSFDKVIEYLEPTDNLQESDKELLKKTILKFKHDKALEHLNYHFQLIGISRALLQELAVHRMATMSTKSSRYTLKELKNDDNIILEKYCTITGITEIDNYSLQTLHHIQKLLKADIVNDIAKYNLIESYKTRVSYTINGRSLTNLFKLRMNKSAHIEFQILAEKIYNQLPEEHKFLYEEVVKTLEE